MIARNIAPGVFRKGFAFEKWVDFDADMFDELYNDDSQEREFTHKIYGYDNNPKANEIATHNIKAAGVSKDVVLKLQPFQQFEQPKEKSVIITNPPYGERISTNDLLGLYQMIGERLKHAFVGNEAWVLSYREECFDQIGLSILSGSHPESYSQITDSGHVIFQYRRSLGQNVSILSTLIGHASDSVFRKLGITVICYQKSPFTFIPGWIVNT